MGGARAFCATVGLAGIIVGATYLYTIPQRINTAYPLFPGNHRRYFELTTKLEELAEEICPCGVYNVLTSPLLDVNYPFFIGSPKIIQLHEDYIKLERQRMELRSQHPEVLRAIRRIEESENRQFGGGFMVILIGLFLTGPYLHQKSGKSFKKG